MAPPHSLPSATGRLFFSNIMVLASFRDWGMMGERKQRVGLGRACRDRKHRAHNVP